VCFALGWIMFVSFQPATLLPEDTDLIRWV
jgi:hypothetical protein